MRTRLGDGTPSLLHLSLLIGSVERGPTLVWHSEADDDTTEWDQVAQEMFTRHWIPRPDSAASLFLYGILFMAY